MGDKFFLKNNMILCQTDYEEGLMKEGYAPQVRWPSDNNQKEEQEELGKTKGEPAIMQQKHYCLLSNTCPPPVHT